MPEENNDNKPNEVVKEPTPLSLEGATVQLDLPIKPPPAAKATPVAFNKPGLIKGIMGTNKETGSMDPEVSEPKTSSSGSGGIPPVDKAALITRLGGDDDSNSGAPKGPPPTPEESNDTAGMIIDGFNAIFLIFTQAWSKNARVEDYEVDTEEKRKLKKYLSSIFFKAETKINPIWLFIGLLLITYVPKLQAAWNHRKMVAEEREKNKPGTIILNGNPTRKRRRKNSNDDDAQYYPSEEIR